MQTDKKKTQIRQLTQRSSRQKEKFIINYPQHQEKLLLNIFHKENFQNNPKIRLINPTKSKIGKIAKLALELIHKKIRGDTKLNKWISTKNVVD